ncbi:MAG: hypothetical protein QG635_234 [Bacteroidota bacterium]|nr:hypothetical protein [Bacteroidota bacterium]
MPVYLYKCNTCGKEFNYTQKISDEALDHCPEEVCECKEKGKGEVIRKISKNIGFVFNGSGFYLTDYVHKHNKFNGGSSNSGSGHNGNGSKLESGNCGDSAKSYILKSAETKPAETKTAETTAAAEK